MFIARILLKFLWIWNVVVVVVLHELVVPDRLENEKMLPEFVEGLDRDGGWRFKEMLRTSEPCRKKLARPPFIFLGSFGSLERDVFGAK